MSEATRNWMWQGSFIPDRFQWENGTSNILTMSSGLYNCQIIHFCCLATQFVVICNGSLRKLMQGSKSMVGICDLMTSFPKVTEQETDTEIKTHI